MALYSIQKEEKIKQIITHQISNVKKSIENKTGYKWYKLQDAFIISVLLLLLTKVIFFIFIGLLNPWISCIFQISYFIISLNFELMFLIRETIIIPFLAISLGHNFYRHNIYDIIPDLELRWEFNVGFLGSIQFHIRLMLQKITRKLYFYLLYIKIIALAYPLYTLVIQQICFICFILNKKFLLMFLILILLTLSRIILLLSDFTLLLFYKNLKEEFEINLEAKIIKPTANNVWLLVFWTIRTLEDRPKYLFTLQENYRKQYLEEKIQTHLLKNNLEISNKKNNSILFFIFILFFLFVPRSGAFDFVFGFLTKNNSLLNKV